MVYENKYSIPKLEKFKIPTSQEMKEFSKNYSNFEWKILSNDRVFLNAFSKNIDLAKKEADRILEKKV